MRLNKEGYIERLPRGPYALPETSRFGLKAMHSLETIAQTAAATKGASNEIQSAEAARRFGFSTQVPAQPVFYTTGSTHTVRLGKLCVRLQHVAARKLALAGRPASQALSALWYQVKHEVAPATFERIATKLRQNIFFILPDIAEHVSNFEFTTAQVAALSAARTFWGKVTLIQIECHRTKLRASADQHYESSYPVSTLPPRVPLPSPATRLASPACAPARPRLGRIAGGGASRA